MRVADFFCGGGGFSEGFRQAGFDIIFAVDKWEPAVKTYKGNKPGVKVIQDDVVRIANLPDDEFESLVPDSEIIIGSPPCQSFSHSNKSGYADKSIGIQLIEAYLKIVFRKKYKPGSILKYWVLENVPAVKSFIKEEYTAADFGLEGEFVLRPHDGASGRYNAKYFGAPTNRERYLCGEFPKPVEIKSDKDVITLKQVLDSLGDPLREDNDQIVDINYPGFALKAQQVTDQHYIYELAEFEYKTAKRLKQDKGYMGKMSFPENLEKPARTVMATMTASAREAMVLGYGENRYRLPTVREADQAHFVYELLQNADDAGATRVRFLLEPERLIFAHNGTKRFFVSNPDTVEDDKKTGKYGSVNSITALGYSNKPVENAIGKFGIGFMSVFQYTKEPRILEDLYLGDIRPNERSFKRNGQYAKALDAVVKVGDQLTESLNAEQKQLFEDFMDAQREVTVLTDCETFCLAFKLGAKIMMDVLTEGQMKKI